jgi:hypothetical protein
MKIRGWPGLVVNEGEYIGIEGLLIKWPIR